MCGRSGGFHEMFKRSRPYRGRVGGFYGLREGRLRPGGAIVPARIDGRFGLETTRAEDTTAPPSDGRGGRVTEAARVLVRTQVAGHAENRRDTPKGRRHARLPERTCAMRRLRPPVTPVGLTATSVRPYREPCGRPE